MEYLKGVAGQAKIYIRPLQWDLDLTPAEGEGTVSTVSELCITHGYSLLSLIQSHNRSFVPKKFARAVEHLSLLVSYEVTSHLVVMLILIMR